MVGEHIVGLDQRRCTTLQPLDRQAVGCIDTRGAQDADCDTVAPPPGTQHALGIDPPAGTGALWFQLAGFVDGGAGTIPVNPCRAYVNQAAW